VYEYLVSTDIQTKLNASTLVLSTTDVGNNAGDLSAADAIDVLSITTRFHRDNPHRTKVSLVIGESKDTHGGAVTPEITEADVTLANFEHLFDGSDINASGGGSTPLHTHDGRYYTETELSTSNPITVHVHWDNITNSPQFGALHWREPVICMLHGMSDTAPSSPEAGWYYLDTDDDHLYKYNGTSWDDQGAPAEGDRVIFRDGTSSDDKIYTYTSSAWDAGVMPEDNWAVMVDDDGDEDPAQYVYDSTYEVPPNWVKIADVDWGDHNSLGGRSNSSAHPASSITYDNSVSDLTATDVQAAIDELVAESDATGTIIWVDKNRSDDYTETGSIVHPFKTMAGAIAAATAGNIIWVSRGTYSDDFTLPDSVSLYGSGIGKTVFSGDITTGDAPAVSLRDFMHTGDLNIEGTASAYDIYSTGNTVVDADLMAFNYTIEAATGTALTVNSGIVAFNSNSIKSGNALAIDHNGGDLILNSVITQNNSATLEALSSSAGSVRVLQSSVINIGGGPAADIDNGASTTPNVLADVIYLGTFDAGSARTIVEGTHDLSGTDRIITGTNIVKRPGEQIDYDPTKLPTTLISTNLQDAIDELYAESSTRITEYVVGKDTWDPYDSIQDAIDAAVADGHTFSNPAVVLVKPGTYTEDVTSAVGVNVISLMGEKSYQTKLTGTLTFNSGAGGSIGNKITTWSGIDVSANGTSGTLIFTGSNPQRLNIVNCEVNSGNAQPALLMNNTGTGSLIVTDNVNFNNTSTGVATKIDYGKLSINHGQAVALGSVVTMQFNNNSQIEGTSTYVHGTLQFNGTSNGLYENLIINNGSNAAITYNSTSPFIVVDPVQLGAGALKGGTHPENVIVRRNAADIPYSNGTSGLSATNVQAAIDEIDSDLDGHISNTSNPHSVTFTQASAADPLTDITALEAETLTDGSNADLLHVHDASAITYDDTGDIHIDASDVENALKDLDAAISAFKIPSGTAFPVTPTPADGDLFYRTDLNLTFQYDGSRSKWLSITQMFLDWGSNSASSSYLNIHGAAATQTGYLMPRNGTIITVTAKAASGNLTKSFEIRRNHDSVTPLVSFSLVGGSYSTISSNVNFDATDYIQVFAVSNGQPARDVVVLCTIAWRE
jgi:hypothetical protein